MNSRIRAILEDYEGMLEMHDEQAEAVDLADIEAREIWDQIEGDLKALARRISRLRRGTEAHDDDLEEIELQMEELSDLYNELGSLSWGDTG